MELQTLGTHSGVGMLATLFTYFGFKQRLNRADSDVKALDDKITRMSEVVLYKDTHAECSAAWHSQLIALNKKMDMILKQMITKG